MSVQWESYDKEAADRRTAEMLLRNGFVPDVARYARELADFVKAHQRQSGVGAGSYQLPRWETDEKLYWVEMSIVAKEVEMHGGQA